MALDERFGGGDEEASVRRTMGDTSQEEVPTSKRMKIMEANQIIDQILSELDEDKHFLRSTVHLIAARLIHDGQMTLRQIAMELRFDGGVDAFCQKHAQKDEIPTRPRQLSASERTRIQSRADRAAPIDDMVPSSKRLMGGGLYQELRGMNERVAKTLREGANGGGTPLTKESDAGGKIFRIQKRR